MKYFFLAISAFALTACQQGPLVKSPPLDVEKMISDSARRRCDDKKGTGLYAKCFDREVAKGRSDFKVIEAHFMPKKR
ncbi:hypothetical protein [Agrobacterium tumefaciens]|nr:hypothetical protein [Agrobacterium tumefaciens]NSZ32468.1 hypothetical protein [Agrobacterium tumefaciens]QLG23474.1 hypothetical protein EML4_07055 [Agrobacterium tumefaciens]UXS85984.1 hypothetical protein FY144_07030 [Agrobacterium tumefaciens]